VNLQELREQVDYLKSRYGGPYEAAFDYTQVEFLLDHIAGLEAEVTMLKAQIDRATPGGRPWMEDFG
jgi:hypothetical protein